MDDDVRAFLAQAFDRLIATHRDLASAHREFLAGPPTAERLSPLLDQREHTFTLARDIENDLAATLAEVFADRPPESLAAIVDVLSRHLPEGERLAADLRLAVSEVVETDRAIQAALEQVRAILGEEIKKIRRGASLMKGYLQPDETGSCFIDKVK